MTNRTSFDNLVRAHGSAVTFHREEGGVDCPCKTLTGRDFRWPKWHVDNPPGTPNPLLNYAPFNGYNPPVCNEQGQQPGTITDMTIKAFVQPVQSARSTRMGGEYLDALFPGELRSDDHLGIFPMTFDGVALNFEDWGQSGEDFVIYDGKRWLVVSSNKIPDPGDGNPHHWECGLRLIKTERPVVATTAWNEGDFNAGDFQ